MGYVITWKGGDEFATERGGAMLDAARIARTHLVTQVWRIGDDGQSLRLVGSFRPDPAELVEAA